MLGSGLGILLDKQVGQDCEMQIKHFRRGDGSRWELTVWNSAGQSPHVHLRLRADTALDLINKLILRSFTNRLEQPI